MTRAHECADEPGNRDDDCSQRRPQGVPQHVLHVGHPAGDRSLGVLDGRGEREAGEDRQRERRPPSSRAIVAPSGTNRIVLSRRSASSYGIHMRSGAVAVSMSVMNAPRTGATRARGASVSVVTAAPAMSAASRRDRRLVSAKDMLPLPAGVHPTDRFSPLAWMLRERMPSFGAARRPLPPACPIHYPRSGGEEVCNGAAGTVHRKRAHHRGAPRR